MSADKPKPVADMCSEEPAMGVKPVFRRGTDTNALAVFAVSFAGWIAQQTSIDSVEQALGQLTEEQKSFIAQSGVVYRSVVDLTRRAAQATNMVPTVHSGQNTEPFPRFVPVPWTFAEPVAMDVDANGNSILFFVLNDRACFCHCYFSAVDGESPCSVSLDWTLLGPAGCSRDLALRMVLGLCDSTDAICESIRDGVGQDDFFVHETYAIMCPSDAKVVAQKGSYRRPLDFGGEVFVEMWWCEPEDYENIGEDDLCNIFQGAQSYFTGADAGELDFWKSVRGLLAKSSEAEFQLQAMSARNLGMRNVLGIMDRTIAMLLISPDDITSNGNSR